MTYRNGIKEYALTTVLFGGCMSIFLSLSSGSILLGLPLGLAAGVLFSLLIALFVKVQEKKFDKLRTEIAATQTVICDGGATIDGNGGWLFFTDEGLAFHAHKINLNTQGLNIPLSAIRSVGTKRNCLLVELGGGHTVSIVVSHVQEWKAQLDAYIGTHTDP